MNRNRRQFEYENLEKMVLDSKTHNEYGTIYTQDILPHAYLGHSNYNKSSSLALETQPSSPTDNHLTSSTVIVHNHQQPPDIITIRDETTIGKSSTTVPPESQSPLSTNTDDTITTVNNNNNNNNNMTTDLHQRQPLIPSPQNTNSPDRWTQKDTSILGNDFYDDDDEDSSDDTGGGGGGGVKKKQDHHIVNIVPNGLPLNRDEEPRFPKEKCKTFIAFVLMVVNFLFTTASLAVIHERVPDRERYPPLSDVFLDNVPEVPFALDVSEYIIIILCNSSIVLCVFHKHRFIVFRRLFILLSLLYFLRSITMYVTVLPMSSKSYYCSPKLNNTSSIQVIKRVIHLVSGMGLAINGKHSFCGDYIYSGHTVILVLSSLIISEYTPRKFYLLHWFVYLWALIGVILILIAHGHYTIDVIIAYYITTRIFWIYHTLCNNQFLKSYSLNNYLSRSWWFPFFLFFEGNVGGVVPLQYDWPLPWPRRFVSKHPIRNS